MTKNTEGAAGDLTADLAALRQDVARLAETASELVQAYRCRHRSVDRQDESMAWLIVHDPRADRSSGRRG